MPDILCDGIPTKKAYIPSIGSLYSTHSIPDMHYYKSEYLFLILLFVQY